MNYVRPIFVILSAACSMATLFGDDETLLRKINVKDGSKKISIDLGVVRPGVIVKETFEISGLRRVEMEKIELVPSCGCVSTRIRSESTAEMLQISIEIAAHSFEGKAERQIIIRRSDDKEVLASLNLRVVSEAWVQISPALIDVTEKEGIGVLVKFRERYAARDEIRAEIVNASIEGPWIEDATHSVMGKDWELRGRICKLTHEKNDKQLHVVRVKSVRDGIESETLHELLLTRKMRISLLKSTLRFTEGKSDLLLNANAWLKGCIGVDPNETKLVCKLLVTCNGVVQPLAEDLQCVRLNETVWICRITIAKEKVENMKQVLFDPDATVTLDVANESFQVNLAFDTVDK